MLAGAGSGSEAGVGADFDSGKWWEWGRQAGVILAGRVVMSLRQCRAIGTLHGSSLHCEASILTAAETEEEERRCRHGKRCHDTKQMCCILSFSLPHCPLNLFVCSTYFLPISVIFWLLRLSHVYMDLGSALRNWVMESICLIIIPIWRYLGCWKYLLGICSCGPVSSMCVNGYRHKVKSKKTSHTTSQLTSISLGPKLFSSWATAFCNINVWESAILYSILSEFWEIL